MPKGQAKIAATHNKISGYANIDLPAAASETVVVEFKDGNARETMSEISFRTAS